MPAQVAGVMIGDPLVCGNPEIESLKELGDVDDLDPLLLQFRILGLVVEGAGAVGAAGDDRLGPRSQDALDILAGQMVFDRVAHVLEHAATADLIDEGVVNLETVQEVQGGGGGLILAIQSDATHKIDVFSLLVLLSVKILSFALGIDVGVPVQNLIHPLESRVARSCLDHVLSGCFDDFGHVDAGGAGFVAARARGALKQGLDQLIIEIDLPVHDLFEEEHLPPRIEGRPKRGPEDRAHGLAKPAPGAPQYLLPEFLFKFILGWHLKPPVPSCRG